MKHERDAIKYTAEFSGGAVKHYDTHGRQLDPEREQTIRQLRRAMWEAAEREDYERAAVLRDRLRKLETEK